ncbi:hypothetical protein BAE44_0009822 [Dichanthelium oligosanthes]|uniref:Alpha/beta hydrolase fold-3 domain-containing protein n=1 Tax=Dichanthelium oligosanthes TaxID=888268 RepID=A0A1E5VVQ1_9POAL|nr:hypothetical protein BAE44_0009822 [Dichanthelium oligosanthes]
MDGDGDLHPVPDAAGVRPAVAAGAAPGHHADPLANSFGPESPKLGGVALQPMLVVAAELDLLRDREADYVAWPKAMGKPVEFVQFKGQHHGFFVVEPAGEAGSEVVRLVELFV